MATKSLFKKPKRTRPQMVEIDADPGPPPEVSVDEIRPLINVNEYNRSIESNRSADPTDPTAPPEEEYRPTGLANPATRAEFTQKVYLTLMGQKTVLVTLVALFTYIPHLRKVFRKWVFDPLFLSSWLVSFPLILFVALLAFFPKVRRRFAKTTLVLVTSCLALLISYAITLSTAKSLMYSMGFSTLCDTGAAIGSRGGLDVTKWRYISLFPITMIGSSFLAPSVLRTSLNNTIWPSIFTTGLTTYLACNTVPVIRHNDLELEPNEYVFAAAQLYLNPERSIRHRISQWCFGGPNERRMSSAYQQI